MSRSIVRRLTVAIALLAVLGLALPAGAATSRPRVAGTPVTLGSSLVDQVLSWLGSFWATPSDAHGQAGRTEKTISAPVLQPGTNGLSNSDRGAQIDPNGGS